MRLRTNQGFTFIELIVVLTIVAIVSGVLLFNYGSFGANIDLMNVAQDIALNIKSAQTAAISGSYNNAFSYNSELNANPNNPDDLDGSGAAPTYGIYFDLSGNTSNLGANNFAYFLDNPTSAFSGIINDNPICDPSTVGKGSSECLSVTSIPPQDEIAEIAYSSSNGGTLSPVNDLGITFTRPFPNAYFASETSNMAKINQGQAYIEVESTKTKQYETIVVYSNGQIAVLDGSIADQ